MKKEVQVKKKEKKVFRFDMLQKRQALLLAVMLFVVAAVCFGFTYAWIKMNEKEVIKENMKLASLEVVIDGTNSSSLIMEDPYPMNEAGGLSTEPYKFTLTNTGTSSVNYSLNLVNDTEAITQCAEKSNGVACKTVSIDNLRYSLKKNHEVLSTGLLAENKGVIDMGIVSAMDDASGQNTVSYELKLWVDYDTKENVTGSKFYGKLDIRMQTGN